jgi:hypothetical protein
VGCVEVDMSQVVLRQPTSKTPAAR